MYCFIIKYWRKPTRTGTVHPHVNIASFSVSFSPEPVFELLLMSNIDVSWYPKLFQSLTVIIGARDIPGFVTSAFVPNTIEDCGCLKVSSLVNQRHFFSRNFTAVIVQALVTRFIYYGPPVKLWVGNVFT